MYSSLFSAGLIQLWDSDSPQPSPLQPGFPKRHRQQQQQKQSSQHASTSSAPFKSFISFDERTLYHQPTTVKRRRSSDKAAIIPDADNEYRVFMRASSPSPSRRSMDSAVTLPTRSGTYRSRSGTRRESGRPGASLHTAFSTTTSSSFAFYPPSSSDASSPPPVPTVGLARRRSLPLAKPAPYAVPLPSVPATGTSLSHTSYSSTSRTSRPGRRLLSPTSPWRSTPTAKKGNDTRTSFVPSEFSSGSSTNTISYGMSSSSKRESSKRENLQPSSPRGDRREVAKANISLVNTDIGDPSPPPGEQQHHSNFRSHAGTSRASSPWTLPQIQTSDFRLSIALPRSFTPSITSPTSSSSSPPAPPPRRSTPINPSPLTPSSSSIHSLQSIQSMQSMLESTSSTSTVTLDELAEAALDLDDAFDVDQGVLGLGPVLGSTAAGATNGEDDIDLGVEDGLQSFRVSFDLEALGLDAAMFDTSLTFPTAGDAHGGEVGGDAGLFPMSVCGSSSSENSEKGLSALDASVSERSPFSSVRSRSTLRSRQTLLGIAPPPPTPTPASVHPYRSATPNPAAPAVKFSWSPSPAEQVKMKVLEGAASFPIAAATLKNLSGLPSPPATAPNFDKEKTKETETSLPSTSIQQRLTLTSPSSISLPTPSSTASMTASASKADETHSTANATQPSVQTDRASTIGRASTVASTRYKKSKRSDALAQLEGRALQSGYQYPPPHLKSFSPPPTKGARSKSRTKTKTKNLKSSFFSTEEEDEGDVNHDRNRAEEGEVKSISVTSFLPESVTGGAGPNSTSSYSTMTISSTKAGDTTGECGSESDAGSGSRYAHSEWDLSFGPSRHDKRRTRRVMMLSNAAFIVGDLDGPASRSSPALLVSAQQQQETQHLRSHSNPGVANTLITSIAGPRRSSLVPHSHSPSSVPTTPLKSDGPKTPKRRRGPGMPLSTQSVTSNDSSSFACTGMAWSEGGFVSFIDSDSEDYPSVSSPAPPTGAGTGATFSSSALDKDGAKSKEKRKKEEKEKMSKREKLERRAAEKTARNPKRHGITTTAGGNFIDLR